MNKKGISIFCIGSNLESFECLKFLTAHNCAIEGLITLPSGYNKHVSDYYDLHDFCKDHSIEVIDTTDVNSEETVSRLRELEPDVLFTLGWSQIFKQDFIKCFSRLIVGTHPSKLPYGRGRAPVPWTILENLRESAVSFFKIDQGVDTGNIIMQRHFKVPEGAYVNELYDLVAKELAKGFLEIYQLIISGEELPLYKQKEDGVTVRGKRTPADGFIDFNRSFEEIERLIRAVSYPYPGAYCYYKDKKIIFWKTAMDSINSHSGTLGQILTKSENGILVQFSNGTLWLNNPCFDNGEDVEMRFFRVGDKLGYNVQDEIFKLKMQLFSDTTI